MLNNLPRSFADVVKGKILVSAKHTDTGTMGEYQKQQRSPSLHYTSREEDRSWLKDCWFGEVFSIEDLLGLESKFKESGILDCSLQYLGGKEEFFKWAIGEWDVFMAADSNTRERRCLEFTRILLYMSYMSTINSKLEIRVDGDVVPIWVAEDVSLFDGYDILSGINERHSMFSTSSSYVADSMSGQKSLGNRALATTMVENCPTVVHQREEGVAADLSISLQRGFRAPDEGAGGDRGKGKRLGRLVEFGSLNMKQKKPHSDTRRNRGERKKSLQEILISHPHGFSGGWRSRRLPRRKAITWEKLSAHTVESEEPLILAKFQLKHRVVERGGGFYGWAIGGCGSDGRINQEGGGGGATW
ncbi:hypothetical protein Ancab_000070 [Ancistrocladus abbreviatus]